MNEELRKERNLGVDLHLHTFVANSVDLLFLPVKGEVCLEDNLVNFT